MAAYPGFGPASQPRYVYPRAPTFNRPFPLPGYGPGPQPGPPPFAGSASVPRFPPPPGAGGQFQGAPRHVTVLDPIYRTAQPRVVVERQPPVFFESPPLPPQFIYLPRPPAPCSQASFAAPFRTPAPFFPAPPTQVPVGFDRPAYESYAPALQR